MPDEHMWTKSEVAAVGGHSAMYRLRAAALAGELRGYAAGGPIAPSYLPRFTSPPSLTAAGGVTNTSSSSLTVNNYGPRFGPAEMLRYERLRELNSPGVGQ
jgi:hypothetical protein